MSAFRVMAIALCQELQARGVDSIGPRECEEIVDSVFGRTSAVLNEALAARPRLKLVVENRLMAEIAKWAKANNTNRSDAIRRLVEIGLSAAKQKKPKVLSTGAESAARARELARKTVDKISDPSASPEERTQRRRRLTRGPLEFRDERVDSPESKRGK